MHQRIRRFQSVDDSRSLVSISTISDYVTNTKEENPLPRTSTPKSDSLECIPLEISWCLKEAAYRIFRENLEKPAKKRPIRGLDKTPEMIVVGHFVKEKTKDKGKKENYMFKKWKEFLEFWRRFCTVFKKNKCRDFDCPASCQCWNEKSLMNKQILTEYSVCK